MSESRAKNRPKRTPMSQRNRLSYSKKDENFVYRFINDEDGGERIKAAQAAGYEFVVDENAKVGDPRAAEASQMGTTVSKSVGGGKVAYLMRIPREYYDEDRKTKADSIAETEAAMKPKAAENQYGSGLTKD